MATASYRTAQQSHRDIMYLVDQDLPLFDQIQELNSHLAAQETILYAYYVTADSDAYRLQVTPHERAVYSLLESISRQVPDAPMLRNIRAEVDELRNIAAEFEQVMTASTIDWDEARRVLASFSPIAAGLDARGAALTSWVQQQVAERSSQTLERIRLTLLVVTVFAALAIVAAGVLWRVNMRRLIALREQEQAEGRLRQLAYYDVVTGLPNRTSFNEQFPRLSARQGKAGVALALLDLDRFQRVVTTAGHAAADRALRQCADRMQSVLKLMKGTEAGELFRFDGNLFCVIVPVSVDIETLLENMRRAMLLPLDIEGSEFYVSLSAGWIVGKYSAGIQVEELLRKADSAMRAVKAVGGNGGRSYDAALDAAQLERIDIENNLRHALDREEFALVFQPQMSLDDGRIVGAEALLRWHRGQEAPVSPAQFVSIAEETGLIIPIGEWVIAEACRCAIAWNAALDQELHVAVNISARQLVHGNLVEVVRAALQEFGIAPAMLELEITESAALSDYNAAVVILNELRALGVQLSLDDFGTGFSSLGYLQHLPVHKLKVDQTFVRGMNEGQNAAAIVHSVTTLAQGLGLTVIAEGVETWRQVQQLRQWGCQEIQGFLLGKPMSSTRFEEMLRGHDPGPWRDNGQAPRASAMWGRG